MQDTPRHKGLRNNLIATLREKGITNEYVLRAMGLLPRHFFIPPEFEHFAYQDKPFAIDAGQTISQPYTVAYQTQLISPAKGDKILEIGTGSGYQAAILKLCDADIYSIERIEILHRKSTKLFQTLGLDIHTKLGDGTLGWSEEAPFDKILVTAGAPKVPPALFKQLKKGGMLVIPVGKSGETQKMVRIIKQDASKHKTDIFDNFSFVPLIGKEGW